MSEVTPQELVEEIEYEVEDATVIPQPIDPTLSIAGEAADAKATGDAIAAVIGNLRVNEKAPVSNAITLYGSDIKVSSSEGAQTIAEAISSVTDKDASEIIYDTTELTSVKDAIDGIKETIDSEISTAEIDAIFDEVFAEVSE